MALNVAWTDNAISQLKDIFDYHILVASQTIADKLIDKIISSTDILKNNPKAGQREELLRHYSEEFRYLVAGNYKIIYWIGEHTITISSVFDCRQNPIKLKP